MKRRFLAVVPSGLDQNHDLVNLVVKLKRTLREREVALRWVPSALWHVTLAFLGEAEGDLDFLQDWCALLTVPKLELRVSGLGAFPSSEEARVLWLGVGASQEFLDLQSALRVRLKTSGFELEDRPYRPHLTLARFRNPLNASDLLGLGGRKHFGDYPVRELILFESVLEANVVKYSPQRRWLLPDVV